MIITKQNNKNECGICVLTSLTKFFYKNKIDKIDILNKSNVNENGLSLFDFEVLAQKLGINTETYDLEWNEFVNYKTNNFLVLPIQVEYGLHYVIVKKFKKHLTIYDSRYNEPINMYYQEFNKYFAKIMIEVNKLNQVFKFPITKRTDIFKNIRFSYLLIGCLIQIAIVILTTVSANYLNLIINNSIGNSAFKNGLIITFVFFLIFLLNGFTKYILKLICTRGFRQCFNLLSHNIIRSLRIKKQTFINKIDANNFYLIDTSIQSISNFLTYEISFFCSNIFLTITTIVVIVCINPYFLIVAVASIISILIIGFIQYNFKQKILSIAIKNQNINNNICKNYIDYLSTQSNFLIQEKLSVDLKNNYEQFIKMYLKKTKFDACNSLVSEIIYNIIYFLVIIFSTFFIINNKNMNVGQLTLVIAILGMLHSSIDGICDFVIKKIEFKTMSNIYENFVYVDKNEYGNDLIKINNIDSICLKNNDDIYEIENGTCVDDNLINAIKFNDSEKANLFINKIHINNINFETIKEKIFCLNITTKILPEWILEKLSDKNEIIIEGLKLFQINLLNKSDCSLQKQTLINLLYLPNLYNKLIILEDNLRYLNKQQMQWFNKTLLPYVMKSNFVLFTQPK